MSAIAEIVCAKSRMGILSRTSSDPEVVKWCSATEVLLGAILDELLAPGGYMRAADAARRAITEAPTESDAMPRKEQREAA